MPPEPCRLISCFSAESREHESVLYLVSEDHAQVILLPLRRVPRSRRNMWEKANSLISIDCLLPTGLMIILQQVQIECVLSDIKSKLWQEASSYPLFNLLKDPCSYVFICINQKGKREELFDESQSLAEIKPHQPLLKLIQRRGDRDEKLFNSGLSALIDKNLTDFDDMDDGEVKEFRRQYRKVVENISNDRMQSDWDGRALYAFPPHLDCEKIPVHVENKLMEGQRFVVSVVTKETVRETGKMHSYSVSASSVPSDLVRQDLKKGAIVSGLQEDRNEEPNDYVMKIVGRECYLLGEYPLLRYKYIRTCVAKGERSLLMRVPVSSLDLEPKQPMFQYHNLPALPPRNSENCLSLWDIKTHFRIKVVSAGNVNAGEGMQVCVRGGLYHGEESLSNIPNTLSCDGQNPFWNEYLDFELSVCDIPRMARLCFVIYGVSTEQKSKRRRKRAREESTPLAWVNTTLFNHNDELRQGYQQLFAWPVPDTMTDVNPIGSVVSNPNIVNCIFLELVCQCYSNPVKYPSYPKIYELATEAAEQEVEQDFGPKNGEQLKQIIDREPLVPIFEQDKELLWYFRRKCKDLYPYSLPKLLCAVKWNSREDVAQMQILLQSWLELEPEQALELLDYTYADREVRKFAVRCLEKMSDNELMQYLLQLVQVLKYECYLDCDLARFLLRRALTNQNVGHAFFWLLRAEMSNPEVSVRFGLLLEAYCRGSPSHFKNLQKQKQALVKMKAITELIKNVDRERFEDGVKVMKDCLNQRTFKGALSGITSPLDPSYKLRTPRVERCKFMKSKKRPLWLEFENWDDMTEELVAFIFKNGDDLRQDMLSLQLIKIMDRVWQDEGLDLGMTPYGCLSTGRDTGLIEVVRNAETIATIQRLKPGSIFDQFSTTCILDWLKDHNPGERLEEAVRRFTLSCAGYCVATYVLGVGDRHSDNIMVCKSGQLLHIDFGHFLGNVKSKFGIRRERVPFVLTEHFVRVITKGASQGRAGTTEEFKEFKSLCERAFLILRHRGPLFINLLVMMLSAGIPELRSLDDIGHLQRTLVLSLSEDEAIEHFRRKLDEAFKNSWKTSTDWFLRKFKR